MIARILEDCFPTVRAIVVIMGALIDTCATLPLLVSDRWLPIFNPSIELRDILIGETVIANTLWFFYHRVSNGVCFISTALGFVSGSFSIALSFFSRSHFLGFFYGGFSTLLGFICGGFSTFWCLISRLIICVICGIISRIPSDYQRKSICCVALVMSDMHGATGSIGDD